MLKKLRTDQRSMPSRCNSKLLQIQNANNDLVLFLRKLYALGCALAKTAFNWSIVLCVYT
jgi:hypothetical protein